MPRRPLNLLSTLRLDAKGSNARMTRLANTVGREWRRLALTQLRSTANSYVRGIHIAWKDGALQMGLRGTIPMMVERGLGPGGIGTQGPFDMRRTLLRSPKARTSKKGHKYMRIPLRKTVRQIRAVGGAAAHAAAKSLSPSMRHGSHTFWGERLGRGHAMRRASFHATDPLHGLHRTRTAGGATRYGTFRTISSAGRPWVHPGIKARRLLPQVMRRMSQLLRQARF